jgi:hypothetical protein
MMETAERYGGSEKEKIGEVNELVSIHRDGALTRGPQLKFTFYFFSFFLALFFLFYF